MSKPRPVRVYFLADDPAALWRKGDTADDLGPEHPGASRHLLRLDHYDDLVSIEQPYQRGLIARLEGSEAESSSAPEGFSDAELDAWLDSRKDADDDPALD